MARDGQTILTFAMLGVGGYLVYEYIRYSGAIANINKSDPCGAAGAALEASLPFMTYAMLNLGISSPSSTDQAAAFAALQNAMSGKVVLPPTPTPGTTPTMSAAQSPTTVSTSPTCTPTTGSGGGTSSAVPTVQQPTAADLQHSINMVLASADQWQHAYLQLMGAGIDQVYGFSFDKVYGAAAADGTRSSGQLTAQAFLNAPVIFGFSTPKSSSGVSGLGAIAQFYTPVVRSAGSMIYRAQHPSPYRNPSTNLAGFTQPLGMEMALLGRQSLRSNKTI